jgi:hypothetical protein
LFGLVLFPFTNILASCDTMISVKEKVSSSDFIVPPEPSERRGDGVVDEAVFPEPVTTDSGMMSC